jgi:2-polyprenyl-6-hydroxyphenyl methylase/3-demethylubiquinone-9 3-methyltransferase
MNPSQGILALDQRLRGEMETAPLQDSAFDSDTWWDPDGFLYGLHTLLGPLRGPYVISTLRSAGVLQGSRVLDVGSGGGFLTATLSDAGYHAVGIDPSMAAMRGATSHVATPFVVAVGERLPFADDTFEAVVCSEVLEHVEDAGTVIAEVSRVLMPDGVLVFSLPNRTLLSRLLLIELAQRNRYTRVLPRDLHDWNRFIGPRELRRLARRHDLAVQEVRGVSIRVRDVPATLWALADLRRRRINYADAGSRVQLSLGRTRAVAYVGHALKNPERRGSSSA